MDSPKFCSDKDVTLLEAENAGQAQRIIASLYSPLVSLRTLHLITYDCGSCFDRSKFNGVVNRCMVKPSGGLWSSPVNSTYGWIDWCRAEDWSKSGDFERSASISFTFELTGAVLTINDTQDLALLPDQDTPDTWCGLYLPDFEAIAQAGVDAVYLTARGQELTRLSHPRNLYGWDCESVLVLNPETINKE